MKANCLNWLLPVLGDTHPTCWLPRKGFAGCRVPHCPHTAPRQPKQRKEPWAWLRWEWAAWSHTSVTQIRSTGTASQFTPGLWALDVSPAELLGKVTPKGSAPFLVPRALIAMFCLTASCSSSECLRRS